MQSRRPVTRPREPTSAADSLARRERNAAALIAQGKVREMYDAGDDACCLVASDRISTYDVVLPTPIPDKGKVLTGLSVFWFGRTGGHRAQPPDLVTDVPEEAPRPRDAGRAARDLPGRVRGARLPHRARAGRSTRRTGAVCGIELPAGLRESEQLPEPIFTPATKAELGDHDENVDFDRAAEIVGDRAAAGGAAPPLARDLRARRRARARARDHPGRHQVRVRPRRRRHDRARRRGAHAGLVALLAGRRLRARPRPAVLRQAVRARLGRAAPAGTRRRPAPELPDEVVEGTARRVRRGLRAHRRRAVRRAGWSDTA